MIKISTIGDISDQVRGVTYSKADVIDGPANGYLPILRANNITAAGLTFDAPVYVPETKVSSKQRIKANDIVIAASSGSIKVVGKAAQARGNFKGSFGAFCKVLRPSKNVDPNYFAQYFKTAQYRHTISLLAEGANINNLRNEHLDNLQIPLPPLSEQKRIAGILDAADALRAKRREALAQLDTLLQSTFLDLFGDPVTNPKGWEVVELGTYTSKVGSGSTPKGGNESYYDDGISLIRSLNVRDGEFKFKKLAHIDEEQASKLKNVVVKENDVLLNITGASVARVCRVPAGALPARVNQHVCIIRTGKALDTIYTEKLLLTDTMKQKLLGIGESGATRQAITKAQVLRLNVVVII